MNSGSYARFQLCYPLSLERFWQVAFACFVAAITSSGVEPSAFVYSVFFIYIAVFALNTVLQYNGVGRWKGYFFAVCGESAYVVLSFAGYRVLVKYNLC